MEEYAKTELQLSEEQLQEITGGCAQCVANMSQTIKHENNYQKHLAQAGSLGDLTAQTPQELRQAAVHLNMAADQKEQSNNLWNQVVATGHLDALKRAVGPRYSKNGHVVEESYKWP